MRFRPAVRALALSMLAILPALTASPAAGQVVFQRVVTEDVTLIPGTNELITEINNRPAINASGDLVFTADLRNEQGTTSRAVVALIDEQLRVLARHREVAPGAGGAEFFDFEDIRIANDGHVVFLADLSSANGVTINSTNRSGYWLVAPSGTVTKIAQDGDTSPASGMPVYTSMMSVFYDHFDVASGGIVTFVGQVGPLDEDVVFYFDGTSTRSIAEDGGSLLNPFGRQYDFGVNGNLEVVLNDSGDVVFTAATRSQGGELFPPNVIFSAPDGVQIPTAIAVEGTASPVGGTYFSIGEARFNDEGQIVFSASTDPGSGPLRDDFFLSTGAAASLYFTEEAASFSGLSPAEINSTGGGWELSNNGTDGPAVLVDPLLTGTGVTFDNDEGYWLNTDNASRRLLRAGDTAPGLGVTIDDVGNGRRQAVNAAYDAIFSVELQRDNLPQTSSLDEAYYLSTAASPTPQVLLEDSALFQYEPDLPASPIADVVFKNAGFGGQRALNDAGQFACIVSVDTNANDFGDRDIIVRGFIRNNASVDPFPQFGGVPPVVNTPPTVAITSPASGERIGAGGLVMFAADIADAEDGTGDAFAGTVQWTSSIAPEFVLSTAGAFSTTGLSAGMQTVTVTVTDTGGLTASASIDIEVLEAVTSPPLVNITSPAGPIFAFAPGTAITFAATAVDPDTMADLSESLMWTSNLAGSIGTGPTFDFSGLPAGENLITATATNADGIAGMDTVTITIDAALMPLDPPTVTITTPDAGMSFMTSQPVAFAGTAADGNDADISSSIQWTSTPAGFSGSGAAFDAPQGVLAAGAYTITATVTDAESGLTATDTVAITVTQAVNPLMPLLPIETVTVPQADGQPALTGNDVAADGDVLAVASVNADDDTGQQATGAVSVLTGSGTDGRGTTQVIRLADARPYDMFGASVAAAFNTVAIGVPGRDIIDPATGLRVAEAGAVTIATRPALTDLIRFGGTLPDRWTITQTIQGPAIAGAYFGTAVDLSGDVLAVTAPMLGSSEAPALFIYRRNAEGTFVFEAQLAPPSIQSTQRFGLAVAASTPLGVGFLEPPSIGAPRETVAVAAPAANAGADGYVQVYRNINGTWRMFESIQPASQAAGDFFAASVALTQSWLAIGARGTEVIDASAFIANAGAVYAIGATDTNNGIAGNVPEFNFDDAEIVLPLDPAANAFFGTDVDLAGSVRRVGSQVNDNTILAAGSLNANNARAYSFVRTNDRWEGRRVDGSGEGFGASVAITGNELAVGAPGSSTAGVATSRNDDVAPCSEFDLAQPFGVIDITDYSVFIENRTDVNNDDQINVEDDTAFVELISRGC